MALDELRFEIPSEGSQISRARSIVAGFAIDRGYDETLVYQVKVAVSEAVANAIEHGSPKGSLNKVQIDLKDSKDMLVIEVKDEGRFKRRLPTFQPGGSVRGRGLFLISAMMDEVDIIESPNGTTLRLVKRKGAGG